MQTLVKNCLLNAAFMEEEIGLDRESVRLLIF